MAGFSGGLSEILLGFLGGSRRSLSASTAINTPITPTTGPRIPPSPHVMTLSAGGGLGNTQR